MRTPPVLRSWMWNLWSVLVGLPGKGSDSVTPPVRKWSSAESRTPRLRRKIRAVVRAAAESRGMSHTSKAAGPSDGGGWPTSLEFYFELPSNATGLSRALEGRPPHVEVRGPVAVVVRGVRRLGVEDDVPSVPGNVGTEGLPVQLAVVGGDGHPFRDPGQVVVKEDVLCRR